LTENILRKDWWNDLEAQWKHVFGLCITGHLNEPNDAELAKILSIQTIRLAGPAAPFPNIHFELTNVSGLQYLSNLSIAIVTHHNIADISAINNLSCLKSLFLSNNKIESLRGIEELTQLEQLYVQYNRISSVREVEQLVNLKEFYIHDNNITSLEGVTEKHSDKLAMFVCRPNNQLKQKEIIRLERELGIICR
jgi:Leucine-rich repeat (LRR) protein